MRVLIAVPTFENIMPDTFKSIYDLDKGGHECIFEFVRGYDCATARNNIAQKALDLKTDYVLMVDNDVVLPHDALLNLLEDPRSVCLGYYVHRSPSNVGNVKTCLCKLGEVNFTWQYQGSELDDLRQNGVNKIQVHGGGMGCALIKTDVFNKLKYPWYNWINYEDRHGVLSEDLYFCNQCNAFGIPVYADTRVKCGHLLRYVQWPVR